ncbi:MAG: class I SAM-dependent methyltransferase [Planctomycetes bacterium]|nr:class I SAM-dependent methyltransferase [Planctomycetota bacterium]
MNPTQLNAELSGMDIYLLDQILKERFIPAGRVLDVGCGAGRNLKWFARNDFEVYALDSHEKAIQKVKETGLLSDDRILHQSATTLPFADDFFDGIICNALLHMLNTREEIDQVISETWRVLKPGGIWFARLATDLSMQSLIEKQPDGRHRMPSTEWDIHLTSLDEMLGWTEKLGGKLLDPIKTSNVQNQRAMATWVMVKQ